MAQTSPPVLTSKTTWAVQVSGTRQDALTRPASAALPLAATQLSVHIAATHLPPIRLQPALILTSASWQRYSLPLRRPLTTGAQLGHREGFLLRLAAEPAVQATHNHVTTDRAPANGTDDFAAGSSTGEDDIIGVGEVCDEPLPASHAST